MSEHILEVRHLSKAFGSHAVLKDIDFTVDKGDVTTIIGSSGSGKSTLLRCINLLETLTTGEILFHGEDITGWDITTRARAGIGFSFQQPVRFKGIQVLDLIRLAAGKQLSVASACDYLSEVGLCAREYIDREVNSSLSGGELKRIEIATVLARATKLSVFDEPEAGIDLWSFQNLIQVFQRMREIIKGSSIPIISHQERIMNIADEIIVIKDGKLDRQGTREEILPGLIGTASAMPSCMKSM